MPWILEKGLAKSFVYYIINILLIAVNEVHSKGWSHCDLHGANILLQKDNDRIIVRIIDFGSAKEITDNRRGHQNKKDDLRTMSERITSLSRRCKGIEDELLNRFRGDDPKTISSTEEAEMVIEETSARAKKFVRTDDNIVVMERIFTMVGTTRPISDSDISEEMETMNSKSSPPSSSDDYPYGSSSEEKSKEISPNPSTEEAMEYTTVGI
ncbi:uncharacterized protein LOC134690528 [Mytilus trossulus]|uniref:uncharacterized protein LOC134690528 n=1 Tax=Mytilus trossulus TaxID=6551 RepID=UPI00300677D8